MNVNANTALMEAFSLAKARAGWKQEEESLLWDEVRKAREEGRALKSVFDAIAVKTGRKPNSIRNYYYARAKTNDADVVHNPAFVPFKQEEIWDLLTVILGEQAKGVSVRACTLKMGGGDTRAMLRYQNKYRSLIKSSPEVVKKVIKYMRDNSMSCFDPYADGRASARKAGRPRKIAAESRALNGSNILNDISELVKIAAEADAAKRRVAALEKAIEQFEFGSRTANDDVVIENVQLRSRTMALSAELERQSRALAELLYRLRCVSETGNTFLAENTDTARSAFALELQKTAEQSSLSFI